MELDYKAQAGLHVIKIVKPESPRTGVLVKQGGSRTGNCLPPHRNRQQKVMLA